MFVVQPLKARRKLLVFVISLRCRRSCCSKALEFVICSVESVLYYLEILTKTKTKTHSYLCISVYWMCSHMHAVIWSRVKRNRDMRHIGHHLRVVTFIGHFETSRAPRRLGSEHSGCSNLHEGRFSALRQRICSDLRRKHGFETLVQRTCVLVQRFCARSRQNVSF